METALLSEQAQVQAQNPKKKFKQKRKGWFRFLKGFLRMIYKKTKFEYRGEKPTEGAIILSNHEYTYAPMSLEEYADFPVRMWVTHEMNSGLVNCYKHHSRVYYHQILHWNLHLARLGCLIFSPCANLFYKGLNGISTYKDVRFHKTIRESVSAIKEKGENIVIFPETDDKGYLREMEKFQAGFTVLAQVLYKQGIDVKIFPAYYKRKENKYIFDPPILYSELKAQCADKEEMANFLLKKCNDLGK